MDSELNHEEIEILKNYTSTIDIKEAVEDYLHFKKMIALEDICKMTIFANQKNYQNYTKEKIFFEYITHLQNQ
jgi:hypothetical protein